MLFLIDSIFFDTDCISAFLWVKNESLLEKMYSGKIIDQGNIIWSEMLSKRRRIGANSFTEFLKIKN